MAPRHKLAIVDDHALVRHGLALTFGDEADFEIIAEGSSAADAIRIARDMAPDLITLDVNMPGGGIEAAAGIIAQCPGMAILMLSIREDVATVQAAFRAGARGYVCKGTDGNDLVGAVRAVLAGGTFVSTELEARLSHARET